MKKVLAVLLLFSTIGVTAQAAKQSQSPTQADLADALATTVQSLHSQTAASRTLDQNLFHELETKRASDAEDACTTYYLPDVGVSNSVHYWGVVNRHIPSTISCYISGSEPWDHWAVPVTPGEQVTFAIQTDVSTYFSVDYGSVFYDSSSRQPDGTYLTGYIWNVPASYSNAYATLSVSPYATSANYTLAVAKPAGPPPPTATPVPRWTSTPTPPGPTPTPTPTRPAGASCTGNSSTLCLNANRFSVAVGWRTTDGRSGQGQAISLTSDTGYFWFFSSNNVELVVKVVDGRAVNNCFWVFYGALSDVEYTITVNDTATGRSKVYLGHQGRMASVADTAAFN